MVHNNMRKAFGEELEKIRCTPKWIFNVFVFPHEIVEARRRLRMSGVHYRTEKVVENGRIVGYNIYVK